MTHHVPILDIPTWHTPASSYPIRSHGRASIVRRLQPAGVYPSHGEGGCSSYRFLTPQPITELHVDGVMVAIDDPPQWWSMQRVCAAMRGRVLCAGLGLGLMLWAMKENPVAREVIVVEKEQDVIELVWPALRYSFGIPVSYPCYDWATWKYDHPVDSILVDLNRGDYTPERTASELAELRKMYPAAAIAVNGVVEMPGEKR